MASSKLQEKTRCEETHSREQTARSRPEKEAGSTGAEAANTDPVWLPQIDLRHFLTLTDDTGMLQHATFLTPDLHHGYCTDDNARALIAAILHARLRGYDESLIPLQRYLSFLVYAFNRRTGRFRNFMSYDRRWLEEVGSEDSHARAVWALGVSVRLAPNEAVCEMADRLLHQALPALEGFRNIRPWTFGIIGLEAYLKDAPENEPICRIRTVLAEHLFESRQAQASPEWPWWEDILTWGNARLPHALLLAGQSAGRQEMVEAGLQSLQWLLEVQTAEEGHLSIVGNQGWMVRGGERTRFDQQPLEVYALIHACLAAAEIADREAWVGRARRCLGWFHGKNDLGLPVFDSETGGCHDGLTAEGVNRNQGAESTLAYLLSVLELRWYLEQQGDPDKIDRPKGLGVVGASGFADFSLRNLEKLDRIRPVAVWSRTPSSRRRFAQKHEIKAVDELDLLLRDPQVDVVYVATTPARHARQSIEALKRDKHVLCEKPLATNLEDAHQMLQTAVARDRRLGINFMMRYGPLWEPVRQLVERRVLGALLHGTVINCAGDDGLPADHWFWDRDESGGIFIEHGVHFFDLIRSWVGDGEVIHAFHTLRPGTKMVDQAGCTVRYASGPTVHFYHGFHQSRHLDRQEFRLVFEQGEVALRGWIAVEIGIQAVLEDRQVEELQALFPGAELTVSSRFQDEEREGSHRTGRAPVDALVRLSWRSEEEKQEVYGQAVRDLVADFLAGVEDPQRSPRVTAEDGRAALVLAVNADRIASGEV